MTSFKIALLPAIAALAVAGCSSCPASASQIHNGVSFDIARSGTAHIVNAATMRGRGETIIRGEVAFPNSVRDGFFTGEVKGTIDVPGSAPLAVRNVQVHAERRPKTYGKHGYFTIHAGRILPAGSIAHLTYGDR